MKELEKILFAVNSRGFVLPIYASGKAVEWQVYEDTETDWNDVVDGIPAEPGLYVWEGCPKAEYESDDLGGRDYIYGYSYDANSWRLPDQIEWLAIMEGSCPWSSKREETLEPEVEKAFFISLTQD